MTAIMGTFVKIGTLADGTPRIVLDLQCKLEEVAAMGLQPGVPFGIARITKESAATPPKEKPGPLCVMACNFSEDKQFWQFLNERYDHPCRSEADAKRYICGVCGVSTRKDLDSDPDASNAFHNLIRKPFVAWRDAR